MSLLSLTQAVHPESFRKDAVLLSMLPYGIADYDALSLLFVYRSDRSRLVRSLEKQGLLVRRATLVTTSHRGRGRGKGKTVHRQYERAYVVLTCEGIRYLLEYYSDLLAWLPDFDEMTGPIRCRGSMTNRQLQLILARQSASLFFSLVGCETVYERMLSIPPAGEADLRSMTEMLRPIARCIKYERLSSTDYTPNVFAENMLSQEMLAGAIAGREQFARDYPDAAAVIDHPCPVRFYASDELRERSSRRNERSVTDASTTNHNHTGVLIWDTKNGPEVSVVYLACRNGFGWNPTLTKRNTRMLRRQIQQLCKGYSILGSKPLPSMLLVHDQKEFRLALTDGRAMWQSKKIRLGQGAASLHLVPMDERGMGLVSGLCSNVSYENALARKLLEKRLIQRGAFDTYFPYTYNGMACTTCFSLNALTIYRCLDRAREAGEGTTAVLCWDWQRPYLLDVLPGVRVVGVRVRRGEPK